MKHLMSINEAVVKWRDGMEEEIEEPSEKYKFRVVMGDWSSDGHGKSDEFIFEGNYPVSKLRQTYKDSCRLTGVQFNHNQNYTGLNDGGQYGWREMGNRQICTEYEDSCIGRFAYDTLKKFGLEVGQYGDVFDKDQFAKLILNFIKLSLPDFKWEETAFKRSELKNIPPLNGYWNDELNVQFGYGLYY
jgi:hypothetical protein